MEGWTMNDYQKQANDFMAKTGTKFNAELIGHDKYFDDDKYSRDIYKITLERNGKKYSFHFGQSVANSKGPEYEKKLNNAQGFMEQVKIKKQVKAPSAYDVLSCVTKNDPGTFDDFCSDFGYDTDSRTAEKIYFDVQKEWKEINKMFNDVMDELSEIQ
jgi:hypothetical protein